MLSKCWKRTKRLDALWEATIQEDYDHFRLSCHGSNAILVCFVVDSPNSLGNVKNKWTTEGFYYCQGLPIILVSCKKDMRCTAGTIEKLGKTSQSPITTEQSEEARREIGAFKYLECSALTNEGIDEVYEAAIHASAQMFRKTRCTKGPQCLIL
jgi:Ras family protein A